MKIQRAGEDYLECILALGLERGQVRSIDIAARMNVTKPTVSYTMKQFRENGYILMDKDGYITLTQKGSKIAERIYERHNVLIKMLTGLGVNPATAAADACRIEHDLSDESFACIKEHLDAKMRT